MLVLSRRIGETLNIGDTVTVTVLEVSKTQVRLGIAAPRGIPVHRKDNFDAKPTDLTPYPGSRCTGAGIGAAMTDIHEKARRWINSQTLSHGGCIERLSAISNDQVNEEAKQTQIGRMYEEMQIWRYIASLLDSNGSSGVAARKDAQ